MTGNYLDIEAIIIQALSRSQATYYRAVPFSSDADTLRLLVDQETFSESMRAELCLIKSKNIEIERLDGEEIDQLLRRHYRISTVVGTTTASVNIEKVETFFEDLILEAKEIGSSDIHIEVYESKCRVRVRIDGKLIEKYQIPNNRYSSLINKLKIKANLDISEKRLPQDGRIHFPTESGGFDIRVSVLPSMFGEKVVLRILSQDASRLDLSKLGFNKRQEKVYRNAVQRPDGIILISGPTGSGKTTTLYSTLKLLNDVDVNISTVEDPIEYTLEGINQVQVKDNIGLSFAAALRSFLRQDPDIIMLGEIRDAETAEMAIRASLTGHLVLSTIHTNSAIDTISRLIDMGIPPFLIASTLNLSVAQRLIRKLCPSCKSKASSDSLDLPEALNRVEIHGQHFESMGCDVCHYTGYRGRIAIYELLDIDAHIRMCIRSGNEISPESNFQSLASQAWHLFNTGQTSLNEVYSYIQSNR